MDEHTEIVIKGTSDLAKWLKVSRATVSQYLHRANDPIPHFHVGRTVMVPTQGLVEWVNRQTLREATQ